MFSAFFIKRPRFSFVISIVIVLVGVLALFNLPIALYEFFLARFRLYFNRDF